MGGFADSPRHRDKRSVRCHRAVWQGLLEYLARFAKSKNVTYCNTPGPDPAINSAMPSPSMSPTAIVTPARNVDA